MGLHLSPKQLEQFHVYYEELIEWNGRMNLTTITDYKEVQVRHFLDSLTVVMALGQAPGKSDFRVMDVGTGAGLPGIPLAILWPGIKLVLLDSTAKKADFLRHLKHKLELDNTDIAVGRAEDIAHETQYREKFELVLSRAVAPLATLAELTLPFCAAGGIVVAFKKGAIETEVKQAGKAIDLLGGKLREAKRVELEEFTDERYLIVIDKVSPTPPQYPRRPGTPKKRPII